MGITFAYKLGLKSFIYEKSSTQKVTFEFNRGNPVKHFQNTQNLTQKRLRGFQDLEAKKFKLTSGAPFARCATSNRKKMVSNFF